MDVLQQAKEALADAEYRRRLFLCADTIWRELQGEDWPYALGQIVRILSDREAAGQLEEVGA